MDVRSPAELVVPALAQAGGELSPAAVAALIRHPRFPDAMRAVLTDNVRLYKGNRIVNYVGYDPRPPGDFHHGVLSARHAPAR